MELDEIKKILELMKEHDLSEFEMERDGMKISLKKGQPVQIQPTPGPVMMPVTPLMQPENTAAEDSEDLRDTFETIVSPIVGTFFASASPESPPYVEVGQSIKENDVLCIIEAMKVMNEIQSEISGIVREIMVANGEPVEYGQPLFRIEKA